MRCFRWSRLPLPDPVLRLARRLSRQDAPGRPGQRLALALQDLGPEFHQARAEPRHPLGSARPGAGRRPVAAAGRPAAVRRRGGAPDDRGGAGPPARRAVRELRRAAGRRRLDRPGALRGDHRGRGGRGQGPAPGHRGQNDPRPRLLRLDRGLGRAPAARLPPATSDRGGARPSPPGPASRWICDSRPPRPRSWPRTSPRTRAFACLGSTGSAPRAGC